MQKLMIVLLFFGYSLYGASENPTSGFSLMLPSQDSNDLTEEFFDLVAISDTNQLSASEETRVASHQVINPKKRSKSCDPKNYFKTILQSDHSSRDQLLQASAQQLSSQTVTIAGFVFPAASSSKKPKSQQDQDLERTTTALSRGLFLMPLDSSDDEDEQKEDEISAGARAPRVKYVVPNGRRAIAAVVSDDAIVSMDL